MRKSSLSNCPVLRAAQSPGDYRIDIRYSDPGLKEAVAEAMKNRLIRSLVTQIG
jgi:hypothetical protein